MNCPKCGAKIGIVNHQIILDMGVFNCTRCYMCGYYESRNHAVNGHMISDEFLSTSRVYPQGCLL